jgi:hypothetical protein
MSSHSLRRAQRFCLADEFAVDARQPGEILFLSQHLGFEGLQAGGQRHAAIPDLLRPNKRKAGSSESRSASLTSS